LGGEDFLEDSSAIGQPQRYAGGKVKQLSLSLAILVLCITGASSKPLQIDSLQPIDVNGSKQWLLIRTSDTLNPVLLYLHGGPGHSLIPFAYVASSFLTDRFTVVYWDQRGAGLSFEAADPPETLSVRQLVLDTLSVTRYLEHRFNQKKIYLLGHSWGSTLGSLVVQESPSDFYAYIGVGQVISQRSLNHGRYEWLTETIPSLLSTKDRNDLKRMDPYAPVSIRYVNKYGGSIHNITSDRMQQIMSSSPYCPEKYTAELYDKGAELSQRMLEKEMNAIDLFKQASEVPIPVYFFLGKYDCVTPTAPVLEYFKGLRAPHKEIIWFEESGHHMDIEEPQKFQQILIDKLLG
jgi:proline iminopeptidase